MMASKASLRLGAWQSLCGTAGGRNLQLPAKHLVTHGVIVGMTGSGKTGLITVLVEEALGAGVPVLVIDVKGDLPNLLLSFPSFAPGPLTPWLDPDDAELPESAAVRLAEQRRAALAEWGIGEPELAQYCGGTSLRVMTPGSSAGELLHVLSALERPSVHWKTDPDAARDSLGAAVSVVLRLLGRDPDPAKSREHVLLSVLAERRLSRGESAEIGALMHDLAEPPIAEVGALPINSFLRKTERARLAAALNSLLASPTFSSWRQGTSLDVGSWLTPRDGRTPGVVVSVAHLDDEERALVLGLVLEEVLSWVRGLPGSSRLKALVVFDEVYGFLPPHPANPPTKRPLVSLMKQARAFGVGIVVATQNPMDLDYRALSNAGLWCLGRLQTDADRARVIDGLQGANRVGQDSSALGQALAQLPPRWFVVQNAHAPEAGPILLYPRFAQSLMRGPLTRGELRAALEWRAEIEGQRASEP